LTHERVDRLHPASLWGDPCSSRHSAHGTAAPLALAQRRAAVQAHRMPKGVVGGVAALRMSIAGAVVEQRCSRDDRVVRTDGQRCGARVAV
jgi:hypothetical protein